MRSARHSGVQLMCTLPASISRIARTAPATSRVKMPAESPYGVPFACAIAASQSAARAHRDRRAEQLLLVQRGRRVDVGDDRRGDHGALAGAADEHPRPDRRRVVDHRWTRSGLALADQRAHRGVVAAGSPVRMAVDPRDEGVEEVAGHRRMGDHPLHRDAHLAGVRVAARGDRLRGHLQVGIGQDHDRATTSPAPARASSPRRCARSAPPPPSSR